VISIIPLALFGNLIRIVATCLAVYFWGPTMEDGPVHFMAGIVIFLLMMALFLQIEKKLEENEPEI